VDVNYWDENYHLKGANGEDVENGILFTAYYWYVSWRSRWMGNIHYAVTDYVKNPYNPSRDNYIGYRALLKIKGLGVSPKLIPEWWRRLHPWDLCFYGITSRNIIYRVLGYLLYPIYAINMILSCTRGRYTTSTKLLCWLKLQVVPNRLLWKICSYLVKRKHGSWDNVFLYYFKYDMNYPIIKELPDSVRLVSLLTFCFSSISSFIMG
jgi:hypothetical protein